MLWDPPLWGNFTVGQAVVVTLTFCGMCYLLEAVKLGRWK